LHPLDHQLSFCSFLRVGALRVDSLATSVFTASLPLTGQVGWSAARLPVIALALHRHRPERHPELIQQCRHVAIALIETDPSVLR
ncbi:MAG: hypothetical protein ABIO70_04540, partial [Pseudomonadota bacterium]